MTRFDLAGAALILATAIFCLLGLSRLQTNTEDVLQWLPDKSESRQEYNDFEKKFGSDDFLIVTWDGCTIDDPRLEQFCQQLKEDDSDDLIQSIFNGTSIIQKLQSEFGLSKEDIVSRFKGLYFGIEDSNQTLALIELTKKGSADRRESLRLVEEVIADVPNLELKDVIFGGYPYVSINIDNQLGDSFRVLLLPSIICATLVSLYCLRNFTLSLIVFCAALGASACSIAIVPVFGVKFGGLMSIIPALVYILATSGSIHMVHYSLDAIGDARKLVSIGWKPCVISAATTAIGMLSLGRSGFPAIRSFGVFCATGAGFALAYQLIFVPWLLQRFGEKGQRILASHADHGQAWSALWTGIRRYKTSIVVLGTASIFVCAGGLYYLTARVEVEKLFDQKSAIIKSLTDLDSRIGPVDQSEFLIVFDDVDAESFHSRAKAVYGIQRHLSALPSVGVTHSLLDYLPREPGHTDFRSAFKRSAYRRLLDRQREELAKSRFLYIDADSETWRISLRFPFTLEGNVQQQQALAIDAATKYVDAFRASELHADEIPQPRFIYTGKNHLFHSAQLTLLDDLLRNFLLAFAVITPVLILVLRSWSLGLIAMVPNLFPVIVFFGMLGWLGWPVDLAIAMTACVALGIAVDDTTHFLIRFRKFGGTFSFTGKASITELPLSKAIAQCGPAMLHTTSIGAAGLLVYCFSGMSVIRNFSWAITAMLILALAADLFLLPAILMFAQRSGQSSEQDNY